MSKKKEAKNILARLGMPPRQQGDMCCHVFLALLSLAPRSPWTEATNEWTRIHDVIRFLKNNYRVVYAENSRETIRKEAMHPFRDVALIEDNGVATNSPNYRYRITDEALALFRSFGSPAWEGRLAAFLSAHQSLKELYASKKRVAKIPLVIDGVPVRLSRGAHNWLQKAVVEEFAPRFAPRSRCLYLGDTADRSLVKDETRLCALGFAITEHDKMPDIVFHREDRNWLYFVECVTSVGPVSPQRMVELSALTANATAGKVFVTAFPDFRTFKKFADKIAWETEVWIAEMPDHMIHLNGDRFLGPRSEPAS